MEQLIPKDTLTQRFLVEVLAKMYEYHIQKETATETTGFPGSDIPTSEPQSAQIGFTTGIVSSQNNDKDPSPPNPNNDDEFVKQTSQSSTGEGK